MRRLDPRIIAGTVLVLSAGIASQRFRALESPATATNGPIAPTPIVEPDGTWSEMTRDGLEADVHRALQAHRGLAQAIAAEPDENASLDALLALAPYSIDHRLREQLTVTLRIAPPELAVLFHNPIGEALLDYCPRTPNEPRCEPQWRTERKQMLDELMVNLLGSEDDVLSSRAIDQTCRMGEHGRPIANAALASDDVRTQAAGLVVCGCVCDAEDARERMHAHLNPDDPLAPIAALELGRMDAADEILEWVRASTEGQPLSLFAAYGLSQFSASTTD